jgi:hypothetical protein
MMEKDLNIIKDVLTYLHYSEKYSEMLLKHIVEKFNDSGLESITPNFLYYALAYDEGKETARKIANMFEELKNPTD